MSTYTPAATNNTKPSKQTQNAIEKTNLTGSKRKADQVGDFIQNLIMELDLLINTTIKTGIESTAKTLLAAKMKVITKQQGVKKLTANPGLIPNNVRVSSELAMLTTRALVDTVTTAN